MMSYAYLASGFIGMGLQRLRRKGGAADADTHEPGTSPEQHRAAQ
jgi:hypothetical protein